MTDDHGNLLHVGDEVVVTYVDLGRGACLWMNRGTVVGFARSRVKVTFAAATGVYPVGPECLRRVS